MRFFVKAIASGFAMSLGSAIFKKVSKKIGLDEEKTDQEKADEAKAQAAEAEEELDAEAEGASKDGEEDEEGEALPSEPEAP
jgi:hypothetical protein